MLGKETCPSARSRATRARKHGDTRLAVRSSKKLDNILQSPFFWSLRTIHGSENGFKKFCEDVLLGRPADDANCEGVLSGRRVSVLGRSVTSMTDGISGIRHYLLLAQHVTQDQIPYAMEDTHIRGAMLSL